MKQGRGGGDGGWRQDGEHSNTGQWRMWDAMQRWEHGRPVNAEKGESMVCLKLKLLEFSGVFLI